MTTRPALLLSAALLAAVPAGPAAGQSLFSARGLGLPFVSTDARARVLGGVGVGLTGGDLSFVDPAASAGLGIPSVAFALETSWADVDEDGTPADFSGTRFPYIALGYPTGFGTVTLSLGGLLDQRWTVRTTRVVELSGPDRTGRITDEFSSDGGISSVRVGLARSVVEGLDVGIQVGRNIGDVSRVFTRAFDSLGVVTNVDPFSEGGRWSYRGWTASAGAAADLGSVARVAAAYTWSSDLDALPSDDTDGAAASFGLPSDLRLGVTGILSPRLRAVVGIQRSTWSAADGGLSQGGARDTFSWGGGVEWGGASILGKSAELRLGYRAAELPFTREGASDPSESVFAGGLGLDLLTSGDVVLSRLHLALERGRREAGSFEETFWRLATSIRLSGF